MRVDVSDSDGLKKKIEFEIPQEAVTKELNSVYHQIGSTAKLRGFRPGKIPLSLLKKIFWPQIKSQLINNLVPDYYFKAIEDAAIEPIGDPEFDDFQVKEGEPLTIIALLEVRPSVDAKGYKDITVESQKVQATQEHILDVLSQLQEQNANYVVIENRSARENDIVILDYEASMADDTSDVFKKKDVMFQIADGASADDFSKALLGMNKNEIREINLTIPDSFPQKELIGRECTLNITVKEIKEKRLPVLDDEFARDLGEYDSLEELKKQIKDRVQSRLDKEGEDAVREKIMNTLLDENPFNPPDKLIEFNLEDMLDNIENQLRLYSGSGVDMNQWDRASKREELRPVAKRNVHYSLILESIARKEGLMATEDEMDQELKRLAMRSRVDFEKFKEETKNNGSWFSVRRNLSVNKALDFIMKHSVKEGSADEK